MAVFDTDGKSIMIAFIGAIIALAIINGVADDIFTQRNTFAISNESVTAAATVNTSQALDGRQLSDQVWYVTNVSNGTIVAGAAIQHNISSSTGLLTVELVLNDTAVDSIGATVNVSYNQYPDGYLTNNAARSVAGLILIFSALAITLFVLISFIKNGSLGKLIKR